jgi:ADP-heptose:LPS heptosyltransferase
VSEKKRQYPKHLWIEAGKMLVQQLPYQLVISGATGERELAASIAAGIRQNAFSVAGLLTLEEFILVIRDAPLVISVNTGTIHLAAALQTPCLVLYALTNPQHLPWKAVGKVLSFSVPEDLHSKNEVLKFVREEYFKNASLSVSPDSLVQGVVELLLKGETPAFAELLTIQHAVPDHGISKLRNFQLP